MSQNNQMLVREYKGRWYVFDVMAESWSDKNELSTRQAQGDFATREEAFEYALKKDDEDDEEYGFPNSEYGVAERLVKDGADVELYDEFRKCSKDECDILDKKLDEIIKGD
jgi:hypothetical protein